MKCSILTITKRTGGIDVLEDGLRRQTILPALIATGDVEWIVVDEFAKEPKRQHAVRLAAERLGLPLTHVYPPDYNPPRFGKLARASNTGLKIAQGDYIFFLNDYIWFPDDTLEKMLRKVDTTEFPLLITTPNDRTRVPGKDALRTGDTSYTIFATFFRGEQWGFPDVPCFSRDTRAQFSQQPPYHRVPIEWEACVAMAPRQLLQEIGGYDEDLDHGYAQDNVDLANRALAQDPQARIYFMRDVRTISIDHQTYWQDKPGMLEACERNRSIVTPRLPEETLKLLGMTSEVKLSHPTPHITSGNPSICFWMPDIGSWSSIEPEDPFRFALGGRETACIRLSQELVKLGWDVTIYTPVTHDLRQSPGINWIRPESFRKSDLAAHDVLVSMDRPDIFEIARAKRINVCHFQCSYAPAGLPKEIDARIDHYFLLSNYQRYTLRSRDPAIDADKCVVFGNGIDLARYDDLDVRKIKNRLVWSSSPDRGLWHLIRWWPQLREAIPDLSLRVFYDLEKGIGTHRWTMSLQSEWYLRCKEGMTLPGVEYMGPVDQLTLAREQKKADLFVYPCDPVMPTETWCITALENCAAGIPMLLSVADCLQEVYGGVRDVAWFCPLPVMDAEWVSAIEDLLTNQEDHDLTLGRARRLAEHFTWEKIAARWDKFLARRLTLDNPDAISDLIEDAEQALNLNLEA